MKGSQAKNALNQWLSENAIPAAKDLLNMAFVPRRSYDLLLQGTASPQLAAQFRIFLVTGLLEFKLTSDEQERYESLKKKDLNVAMDENIAKYFIGQWKQYKILPNQNESLTLAGGKIQHKDFLRKTLAGTTTSSTIKKENDYFNPCITEIEKVLSEGNVAVKNYRKRHDGDLRKLHELLTVIFSGNPESAYAIISQTKKQFKH